MPGAIPMLSCKQAAVHDPQNALVEEGGAIPALPCKLAVVITECSGGRKGVLSLRCHASSLLS
jgi:hypothetical protein